MTQWTAEDVKALRVRLGLSQSQFAARIGCHVRAVSFWERGLRQPTGLYRERLESFARQNPTYRDADNNLDRKGLTQ